MLCTRLVATLARDLVVELERLPRGLETCRQHHVGDAIAGAPLHGVLRQQSGNPYRWMRLLVRTHAGVHVAVVVVVAFPAKRPGRAPRLHDELVRLLEALPVVWALRVVRNTLAPRAPYPSGNQPAARDHVDDGKCFGQPQRIVPDRQHVAEQYDLGLAGDSREDARLDVHHTAELERGRVMLVEHQHIEAHLLGVDLLVDIAIEQVGRQIGVVDIVRQIEVGQRHAHDPRILIRTFGEVSDLHPNPLMTVASASGCSRSTQ